MGRSATKPAGHALPPPPEWHWTVREVAFAHRMSDDALLGAIRRGELGAIVEGKGYKIPHSAYLKWLKDCQVRRELRT